MGIFGSHETIRPVDSQGPVRPDRVLREQLPDVGEFFLQWCDLPTGLAAELEQSVDDLRLPGGSIPLAAAGRFGIMKPANGPLTFLTMMVVHDPILFEVWAAGDLRGQDKKTMEAGVRTVLDHSGHAAAASWAIASRPDKRLYPDFLADRLIDNWTKGVEYVRNNDFTKACQRWPTR